MSLKKGQAPESFKQGKLQKRGLQNRTPEERREIAMKGVEARIRNAERRKMMKENLSTLLKLDVKNPTQKQILKEMGIEKEDMTNQMLLMVALFRKGMTGDVSAIKQIVEMMEEVGIDLGVGVNAGTNVTINITPKKRTDIEQTENKGDGDDTDIWSKEEETAWNEDEIWGDDIY